MVDHEVRLERMLKDDKKRKKQLTLPLVGAIVLTFFYIWTTNVFLLYAMIFFGQFPALYKSWHRKKLLLSFNEDKRYQQLVRSEFLLGLTSPLLVLILITSVELEWISLFMFVIVAFIGIMVLLILSFPIDRKLKEIDPLHVTGVELGHVQLQRKKRKSEA
ncbi:conserved membrane hypothetical protein [Exiguobacterium sp. 8H]|uniref:hypothetical protein n=1 Tax=unclassified Exiguobacterium TaxID=2644629 RepID=UPI0012F44990|nr:MULTISPECIES: hypothetical protein [unclassified Exiguobacterium]VXC01052.1 conserved membrane hypothetical protein [Exiguobacterium sp. 8H]VXC21789.1 conserved membrane hypothetical protein [Exiguobacterium sp. 8A]